MPDETVPIILSLNEALVLFEFLSRNGHNHELRVEDNAERAFLDNLLCFLEKQLSAPLTPGYADY